MQMDLPDLVEHMRKSQHAVVVIGAGISTSCGIPDFRSSTGIYTLLEQCSDDWAQFVSEPQEIFSIHTFTEHPRLFYAIIKSLYQAIVNARPTIAHQVLALFARHGATLVTQNVDGLELEAGVPAHRVIQCHGSVAWAQCMSCGSTVDVATHEGIQAALASGGAQLPVCSSTSSVCAKREAPPWDAHAAFQDDDDSLDGHSRRRKRRKSCKLYKGIMKPGVTLFHEALCATVESVSQAALQACDLFIVVGTSLKVQPIASYPLRVKHGVRRVLINAEPLPHVDEAFRRHQQKAREVATPTAHGTAGSATMHAHLHAFDLELIGDADSILACLWSCMPEGLGAIVPPHVQGVAQGEREGVQYDLPNGTTALTQAYWQAVDCGSPLCKRYRYIGPLIRASTSSEVSTSILGIDQGPTAHDQACTGTGAAPKPSTSVWSSLAVKLEAAARASTGRPPSLPWMQQPSDTQTRSGRQVKARKTT